PTTENSNAKLGLKPSHYKRRDNSAARPSPPRAAAPTRWFGTRQTLLGHDHASGLQFPMWKVGFLSSRDCGDQRVPPPLHWDTVEWANANRDGGITPPRQPQSIYPGSGGCELHKPLG